MKQFYLFISSWLIAVTVVMAQNNPPVATGEEVMPVFGSDFITGDTTITINVLLNDTDPDGDNIELAEVKNRKGQPVEIAYTDSTISLSMAKNFLLEQGYEYRVREKNDPGSISNWATLVVNPCIDPDYPVAKNDTLTGMRGYQLLAEVLANDYHPLSNDLFVFRNGQPVPDGDMQIGCPFYENDNYIRIYYVLSDTSVWYTRFDMGLVWVNLMNSEFYDSLDVNNVNARFNCFGNQFWDMDGLNHYEVPNGSGVSGIFSQVLWIGGLDENDQLHLAAERYRQVGNDYWPGPVSTVYDSLYDMDWLHIWKLNREEIEYHKAHWWQAGYEPIYDIATWPGNGDPELGQLEHIAPFEDHNNNGVYEPMQGDAPIIKGDQALFFVYNDARSVHTETEGTPLGLEIHAMAYAYDMPEDSALWSTIFLNYKIINRSDTAYHDTYLGVFTDTDLGYAWDDYTGCDVQRGMYYTYNGTPEDGNGEPGTYGENPPAQGILFLGGPYIDEDGIDNPKFDEEGNQLCDESINGMNFGDTLVDNERYGMTHFIYFNNSGATYLSDPQVDVEYYSFLHSYWKDNSPLLYGGNGHPISGAVGPECHFMFPGDSDTCNWGTNGVPPNGGYNQPGMYWTEEQVANLPSDRRGLGSCGPFTFQAGDVHYLDLALVWARAYDGNPWSSVELLKERASYIKEMFEYDESFFSAVNSPKENKIRLYPNPASGKIRVQTTAGVQHAEWTIFNLQGIKQQSGIFYSNEIQTIDIQSLPKGLYIYRLNTGKDVFTQKFLKN